MNFQKIIKNLHFMLNTNFLYQQNAHFILKKVIRSKFFNITFCKNFIGPQRSIGPKKECNFEFQKFIIKKPDHKKKKFSYYMMYIDQFYLQISLEEFWSFYEKFES